MKALTRQEQRQLRDILKKLAADIMPQWQAEVRRKQAEGYDGFISPPSIILGQNFFLSVMHAVWDELGFSTPFEVAELGTRMAAYMVTATPMEQHQHWTDAIMVALPNCVATKVREGLVFPVAWKEGDQLVPAVPTKHQKN